MEQKKKWKKCSKKIKIKMYNVIKMQRKITKKRRETQHFSYLFCNFAPETYRYARNKDNISLSAVAQVTYS